MAKRPAAEIDVTHELVRGLIRDQFPQLAELALEDLSRGWDNTNLRLGNDYLVRMPHRAMAAPLILSEQRWLPELARRLDLAIPVPEFRGVPAESYPWHWSITPWFAGVEAATATLAEPASSAEVFGRFLNQLHQPAPDDAPTNPYRGCSLAERRSGFETQLARLGEVEHPFDRGALAEVFDTAAELETSTEQVWLHGDLHGRNMVVNADGQLSAVIDWGDLCSGDRATDLAGAFMLVPHHLDIVRQHCGADDQAWGRARGWALNFGVVYVANGDDDPVMSALGRRLLTTLLR